MPHVPVDHANRSGGHRPSLGGDTASRIRQAYRTLSKGQRRVADLTLGATATVALRSASKVSTELGVSTSTVVRFATSLGYTGYPEFQEALQADLLREVSTVNRLQATKTQLRGTDAPGLIRDVLERDASYILDTVSLIGADEFETCVKWINEARRVYVVGPWSSHAPAYLLSLGLGFIGIDTRLIGSNAGDLADDLHGASASDLLIAVSIRRYGTQTITALDLAGDLSLRRMAITDNPLGPIGMRSHRVLTVRSGDDRFFRSVTAAVSIANLLITACVLGEPNRAERSLDALERLWARAGAHFAEPQSGASQ